MYSLYLKKIRYFHFYIYMVCDKIFKNQTKILINIKEKENITVFLIMTYMSNIFNLQRLCM